MSDFILYNYFRSSASFRVRIALNLKGIAYEYRPVHLLNDGGEQNRDEYRDLNPSGEVPTLLHRGRALFQSMAILQYLDEVAPEPPLFAKDPYQRAQMIAACEIVNAGMQPLGNLRVLQELERRFGLNAAGKAEWIAHWIKNGFRSLESTLTKTAAKYSFGNEPSAADAFLVPQATVAMRNGVELEAHPLIAKIYRNCMELETFAAAGPDRQPDTPRA